MINKYEIDTAQECPHCGKDRPEHHCHECHSDIDQETCWRLDGHCQKCFDFINIEIPKIEAEKERLGVKCKCVDIYCSKCLLAHCKDDNCPVHTIERKNKRRQNNNQSNSKI